MNKVRLDLVNLCIMYEGKTGEQLTISKLSEQTGIRRQTLQAFYHNDIYEENNKLHIKSIKFNQIDQLCTFFGCSIDDLIKVENNS